MEENPLIAIIAVGFAVAWVLGLVTQWLRLSPIVGYLLAGVAIGPYTPGFHGDLHLAHELAEIGVILLMFGVGLHFHLDDLIAVKSIAVPGAIIQCVVTCAASIAAFTWFGIDAMASAVIGVALSVASTVVLMRVLMDANVLTSPAGHVSVGWSLVQDVITVIVLILVPILGSSGTSAPNPGVGTNAVMAIAIALLKLAALVAIVVFAGLRIVPWALTQVARLRSRELFTLTVMVFSIAMAAGAYALFGASMALGAFLAGMMVAQSPVSHQAAADALPLRDAFAVLFFVSVGMLFDPMFLIREPLMMLAAMAIIVLLKPLIALVIAAVLGHSVRTALTVALALAQIGEFSFILSDLARKHGLMPEAGHNVLVGGAILSITLNPLLFRSIDRIERWLRRSPRLWALLNSRAERKAKKANLAVAEELASGAIDRRRLAIIVGFGPVGRTVDRLLGQAGLSTLVIDTNMDTIAELRRQDRKAIFGDASREAILDAAGAGVASHLVVTLPQAASRAAIVSLGRKLNPKLKIFVRAHYLGEREELERVGMTAAIFDEGEAAVALARLVLSDTGTGRESIEDAVRDIRTRLILDNVSSLRTQPVRNVMIPWTRVRRLSNSASIDEVRKQLGDQHFSRWPIVDAGTGQPVGYLLAKDLIGLKSDGGDWLGLVRPLSSVSPEADIESTLLRFQQEGATIAVVRDRNSSVGIITIEDILEQVIGRIEDEYPRDRTLDLSQLLFTDERLLELASSMSEPAIQEMAARIPSGQAPPDADIAALAIAREHEMSTNLGFGIAIPHARCSNLKSPLVVFGRSREGVMFDESGSDKVHLIFLLITPSENPSLHVHLLSQVAGFAGDAEQRQKLLIAQSADEIRQIVLSETATVAIGFPR